MATEIDTKEVEEILKNIKEFNEVLDKVLPQLLPACKETAEKVQPALELLFSTLWSGMAFDSLIVMGNASYLAREMIKLGVPDGDVAIRSVAIAQQIVKLSRS